MAVGAADAEARHPSPARAVAGRPVPQPRVDVERAALQVERRVGLAEPDERRQLAVVQREHGLDEPGHAGGDVAVADACLDRAERTELCAICLSPEHLGEGPHLDRVADEGAGAVALQVGEGVGVGAGHRLRVGDDLGLTRDARRRVAGLEGAVVVRGVPGDHGEHGVAVGLRVGEPFEHDDTHPVAEHGAAGARVERTDPPVSAVDVALGVLVAGLREGQARRPGQGRVARPGLQRLARHRDRDQRGRARRLHVDARTAQVEQVRDARRHVVLVVADLGQMRLHRVARVEQPAAAQVVQQVGRQEHPAEHPRARPVGARGVPGVLQRLPTAFEEKPVLRVQQRGLLGADAPESGFELLDAVDERADAPVVGVGEHVGGHAALAQLLLRQVADRARPVADRAPERVGVGRPGEAAGDTDDRDRLARSRRRGRGRSRRRHRRLTVLGVGAGCVIQAGGERAHGGIGEDVDDGDGQAPFAQPRADPRGGQRVPADVEEVDARLDRLQAEFAGPGVGDEPLQARGRRVEQGLPSRARARRGGQLAAVHLAGRGQRQMGQRHDVRGHRVGRESPAQMRAQLRDQRVVLHRAVRDDVGDEVFGLPGGRIVQRRDEGGVDAVVGGQRRLHRAGHDAVAAQLDHERDASGHLEVAVGQQPPGIPGAEQQRAVGAQRVGHEALRGRLRGAQLGAREVAPGQAVSADVDLAGESLWYRAKLVVEQVHAHVAHRLPERRVPRREGGVDGREIGGAHVVGLGDAVVVEQPDPGEPTGEPLRQRRGDDLAVEVDDPQVLERGLQVEARGAEHLFQQRRGEQHPRDPLLVEEAHEARRVEDDVVAHDVGRPPAQDRAHDLPHEEHVAGLALVLAVRHVPVAPVVGVHRAAVRAQDALRLAGRARRHDAVGEGVGSGTHALVERGRGRLGDAFEPAVGQDDRPLAPAGRQRVGEVAVGEHDDGVGCGQRLLQQRLRVGRVDRQVRAAGLEGREVADDEVGTRRQADTDERVDPYAAALQGPGEQIGALVEFAEGQAPVAVDDRDRLRGAGGLRAEQLV